MFEIQMHVLLAEYVLVKFKEQERMMTLVS